MTNPILIPRAFAANGLKNNIQDTRQTNQDPEEATWSDGFPAVTMQPMETGGLPPKGQDFNGILNAITEAIVFMQKGGKYYFDIDFANIIKGYPTGSVLLSDDNTRLFISVIDGNMNNPNNSTTGWNVLAGGEINAATALRLKNPRKIQLEGEVSGSAIFDGSENITINTTLSNLKVINNLTSTDTKNPLAAAQGKILADMIKDAVSNAVPSGAVQYFAMPWAPQGWLEANGGEVSRTQYANLFNAIGTLYGAGNGSTTFNLPDLRGQFIRCLDNGRGADPHSGRGIGSWQDSDNKWHQHSGRTGDSGDHQHFGTTDGAGNHTHSVGKTGGGNGSAAATSYPGNGGELSWSGNHTHGFSTTWNGNHSHGFMSDPSGGSESRPINIALLACIKI